MHILLAEDEKDMADVLIAIMKHQGFDVDWAENGAVAVDLASRTNYDCMVFDIMMPVKDGITALKEVRAAGDVTPVIMLTAKSEVDDRITGLDAGADDYLIKPYDLDELSARIRALLRRSAGRSDPIIRRGRLTINPSTREVLFNGESVLLSSKEYALLFALAERPGIVLSRAQLEEKLYNYESLIGSNAIEVHIHHLRKKLSEDSIKTVRGVGYVLET